MLDEISVEPLAQTTVREPTTLALPGTGVAALALCRRKTAARARRSAARLHGFGDSVLDP